MFVPSLIVLLQEYLLQLLFKMGPLVLFQTLSKLSSSWLTPHLTLLNCHLTFLYPLTAHPQ